MRHFGHEGFGQAQEAAAFGRGFASGQGDLRADTGAELVGRDPRGSLLAALQRIEGHAQAGLLCGRGGFPVLKFPDLVDQPGTVRRGAGREAAGETAAKCGRNHVGPLLAVHESSVVSTTDKMRAAELARR